MTDTAQYFVNVHRNHKTNELEAYEVVYQDRGQAIEAAEERSDTYFITLTDQGRVNLASEFSDEYHAMLDRDQVIDSQIDAMKECRA